ncbi:MAG: hypothetical protein JO269_09650 [Burkholderiaceae bacterium]|nr:hypothetical protein [Burkholderiaceae bacterium]
MSEEVLTPEQILEQNTALWNEVQAEGNGETPAAKKPLAEPKPEAKTEVKGDQQDDPQAAFQKDVMARLEKFEAGYNTLAGHVGGLRRNEQELKQLLAAAKAATGDVKNAPTQAQVAQAIQDPAEWAALKRQHPDWAEATEKGMDARIQMHLAQQVQQFDQAAIDKIVEERTGQVRTELIGAHLDSIVGSGDWIQEINSPAYAEWIKNQAPEVQALGSSDNPRDAAKLLRAFESSKTQTNQATNLAQQRQQTLQAATGAPKRGAKPPPVKAESDMTEKEFWEHEARKREQKRARGY